MKMEDILKKLDLRMLRALNGMHWEDHKAEEVAVRKQAEMRRVEEHMVRKTVAMEVAE